MIFQYRASVDEQTLQEARSYIGRELRVEQWNEEASIDSIRHYAWGIGDDNPLFCDEAYGRTSPWGSVIAPPTFLYTIQQAAIAPGLSGLQPIYAGTDWEFYLPVKQGDRLRPRVQLVDAKLVEGRIGGKMILQVGEVRYINQRGEEVGRALGKTWRIPRGESGGLRYEPRQEYRYTPDELRRIEEDVFAEHRQGATPRFWEDVAVGDHLTPVVKGPLDRITMTCYYAGCMGTSGYKACELRWKNRRLARTRPDLLPQDYDVSYFGEYVLPSLGHQDASVAQAIGMPGAYDNGPMRIGWIAHLLTNWMGDHGFLTRLSVRLVRPNIFGDTLWCHGRVIDKRDEEGGLVDIEVWADDQRGERKADGTATVRLPRRGRPWNPSGAR